MPYIADIRELAFEIADQLGAKGNCATDHNTSCDFRKQPLCRACCANDLQYRMRRAMAIEKFLSSESF
jgi:hypothetical protein